MSPPSHTSGATRGRSAPAGGRTAARVEHMPQRIHAEQANRCPRNRSLASNRYSSRSWGNRGNIDDLYGEASLPEHLLECTREFLLSDDPPDGRSIGECQLALCLRKQLVTPLEDRQKVQLLGDPLRVAGALDLEENP